MGRRKRKTLLGRENRNAQRGRAASSPRLGRRKALWRFVGAMAFVPLSGTALGQDILIPPVRSSSASTFAPQQGYPPVVDPAGYATVQPGYGGGPLVAPGPMGTQGGLGISLPSGSVFTPRLVTNAGIGDGLGWEEGYQSIGAWIPIGLNDNTMVMYLDARGFMSYEEGGGGNFTLGYRYYMPGFDRYVGVFGGFDIDAGNVYDETFNRFVVGAESVGRYLTYRVNGYIPTEYDGQSVFSGSVGDPFFLGNNIFCLHRDVEVFQYGGVEGEVGGPLPLVGKYGMSGFVGGYYLASDIDDTIGFKGRLEANVNDDLQLGAKLTTDEVFDTNMWVTMTLRSPRGSWADFFQRDWLRPASVQTQMDRSPEREYRTFVDAKTFDSPTLLTDPTDGLPYLVLHVDPNGDGGDGTFENPDNFISNNPSYDIIYVRPGTHVSPAPIVLFDNQRLLSTAVRHFFTSPECGTQLLPGFTGGPLPVLRNVANAPSAVISLANNNEVSGFEIDGFGGFAPITGRQLLNTGIVGNGITSFNINRNFVQNVTSGIDIVHVGTGTGIFANNFLVGELFGSSLGFSVAAINGSSLDLTVTGNEVTGFRGEDANGSGSLDVGEDLNGNLVLDPGIGVSAVAVNGSAIDANISRNTLNGNQIGLRIAANTISSLDARITRNTIDGNAESGAVIGVNNGSIANIEFTNNEIAGNGQAGINASATLGSVLNLDIGGSSFQSNLIAGNAGTGIAITAGTGSLVQTMILNNDIINTTDDLTPLTRFSGEGINILIGDDASLLNSVIDMNVIRGNASDGIRLTAQGVSTVRDVVIGNLDGNNNNGNFISGNLSGISVIRRGNARVDELFIIDNEIFANAANGIDFLVGGGLLDVTDVLVADNSLTGNGLDGIHGLIEGDGIINLDVRNNIITNNIIDGIRIEQNRFTIDAGGVTGTWDGNLIADNLVHGIDIQSPMLDLIVGTTDVGNAILRNGNIGVLLIGPGRTTFTNNTIAQNGLLNADVTLGAGVDIQDVGFKDYLFVNNRIIDNFGDGVEIAAGNNGVSQSFTLNFVDNVVARNAGRGYDVLNQGNSVMDLTIRGTALGRSVIAENGREGIYVVNTASFNQTQQGETPVTDDSDPTHGMDASAPIENGSFMTLNVMQNLIAGNGTDQTSAFNATTPIAGQSVGGAGLVIRVGTGDGGFGSPFASGVGSDGGFASQGFAGVVATVTDNFFTGNFGADIYTESFVSTVAPPTTAGTWNGTEFDLDNYDSDPLARMDLVFTGNTLEEASFNNTGAFYDNADANFKSRTFGRTAPDPNGPFLQGNRRRNAQRLAYRDETLPSSSFPGGQPDNDGGLYDLNPQPNSPPNPGFGPEDLFLYPGMGESTFRISQSTLLGTNNILNPDGSTTVIGGSAFFILDDQPYNDEFDANGVFVTPVRPDDMPYGWSVIQ